MPCQRWRCRALSERQGRQWMHIYRTGRQKHIQSSPRFIFFSALSSSTSNAHPPTPKERHPEQRRPARISFVCVCVLFLLSIQSLLSFGSSIISATPPGEGLPALSAFLTSHWLTWEICPSTLNLHPSFIRKDLFSSSSNYSPSRQAVFNSLHLRRQSSPPHWSEAYSRERKRRVIFVLLLT